MLLSKNNRNLNPSSLNTTFDCLGHCGKSVTLPRRSKTIRDYALTMISFHQYFEHGLLLEKVPPEKKFSYRLVEQGINPFNFHYKDIPLGEIFKTFETLEDNDKIQFATAVRGWIGKGIALYHKLRRLRYSEEVINGFTDETLSKMFELYDQRDLTAEAAQQILSKTQPQGYVPPLNVGHPLYLTPALQDASTTEDEVDVDERDAQGKHLLGPVYDALFGRATTPKSNAQQPHASPQPDNPKHYLGEIYDDL